MRRWTEPLKARAARYALERSLGPFLEERLRLEQLSLDLRGGTGCLRCLRLRAPAVDELLAAAGAPLELREGVLGSVTVTVPWASLGSRSCSLRVTGLRLALRPRQRGGPGSSPPPSARRDPPPEPPPLEGLEALALTIDGVLRRLRVELQDTELRLELPGGALELRLPRLEYEDEGGPGPGPPPVLLKGLRFGDLRLLWQELPPPGDLEAAPPPLPVGLSPGPSRLSLRLKQNQSLPGPVVEVQGEVGALHLLLPPRLLEALWGLLGTFDPPELFYSMTGSLGGQSSAPPEATPPPSPSPSAAGSPRFHPPSPHCFPPPGQGPPRPGGCCLRVTLGTVTLALPQPGWAPPRGDEQLLWGVLGGGHDLPIPHLRLQLWGTQGGLELGSAGGPRGHLGVARMELTEELPGAEPHRLQVLRFPPVTPPTQPCLRLRYGPPTAPGPGEPPLKEPPPPRELSLELSPIESDLDLGLIERYGSAFAGLGHAPGPDTPPGEVGGA
ncbi:autophagy-related protein 2 homolog A-like [Melopsittacus undulatus]|uniref:autophagy-related protein 2 homolog A-like n=1 Tax=Melopsittacus undulatus TaxID=13146 RepID=UPI001469CAEA|nr:autophagy-related protein 2 homolog A-like [Melopsittacus undulatus]